MSVYYFPGDEPEFEGVVSYSPLNRIVSPSKPFGDLSAEEYLDFARGDLARGDRAGLVNALGNAKRCFHYQTDKLLYRFGLLKATRRSSFPRKIQLLRELNLVSGTLLRVFNRERNAMEHDYTAPDREVAEGSVDLCELFLLATERYLNNTPTRMRVLFAEDERDLLLELAPGTDQIEKYVIHGTTIEATKYGRVYSGTLFKLGQDALRDEITIEQLLDESIPLTLDNQDGWLQILRMFSLAAREAHRQRQYPEEPLAIIQHAVPWRLLKDFFQSAPDDPGEPEP